MIQYVTISSDGILILVLSFLSGRSFLWWVWIDSDAGT